MGALLMLQYVDALRTDDLEKFQAIEAESGDWWGPLLDRGAGAALHFAADHGQVRTFRRLTEQEALIGDSLAYGRDIVALVALHPTPAAG